MTELFSLSSVPPFHIHFSWLPLALSHILSFFTWLCSVFVSSSSSSHFHLLLPLFTLIVLVPLIHPVLNLSSTAITIPLYLTHPSLPPLFSSVSSVAVQSGEIVVWGKSARLVNLSDTISCISAGFCKELWILIFTSACFIFLLTSCSPPSFSTLLHLVISLCVHPCAFCCCCQFPDGRTWVVSPFPERRNWESSQPVSEKWDREVMWIVSVVEWD